MSGLFAASGHKAAAQGKPTPCPTDSIEYAPIERCLEKGDPTSTVNIINQVMASFPNDGELWLLLATAQTRLGKNALPELYRAVELLPDHAKARFLLADELRRLGLMEDAYEQYREVLRVDPDYAPAFDSLGYLYFQQGQPDIALQHFRHAFDIEPHNAWTAVNLGTTLQSLGRTYEAIEFLHKAIELDPDCGGALVNLGGMLRQFDRMDEAIALYRKAILLDPANVGAHDGLLYTMSFTSAATPQESFLEAKAFGKMLENCVTPYLEHANPPNPDRVLRIGFVSGDLRKHPVGGFIEGVLKALSTRYANDFEFVVYYNNLSVDELTNRIRSYCTEWHGVFGMSDAGLANHIYKDAIDILFDLSGHTNYNRLGVFAWKPAPLQVTWLGYWATTGLSTIDYLIADPYTLPASEECYFTESILRLPETRLCFTPPEELIDVNSLPALTNKFMTFGSLNRLEKITPDVIALWSRVLTGIPGSSLLIKARDCEKENRERIRQQFGLHGIEQERLTFKGLTSRADYLTCYHHIDMVLDTFPFPGGATTAEALWMGVPVITLSGNSFLTRQGEGLLRNAGLTDWIARDEEEYLRLALRHAADIPKLAQLRSRLRQQVLASPLYDSSKFADQFAAALREMWLQWCTT
jgi:predicted O-linked N-acetylglucosamine transferase (SPINDLY family)